MQDLLTVLFSLAAIGLAIGLLIAIGSFLIATLGPILGIVVLLIVLS